MASVNTGLYIDPSQLRSKITIQSPATTLDGFGDQTTVTYTNILTTRALIESTTGAAYRESVNDVISSQSTHVLTIRYPNNSITIEPGYRVVFSNNTWRIAALDNVMQRNRVLKIFCESVDEDSK
jgi:head-tail adaptor